MRLFARTRRNASGSKCRGEAIAVILEFLFAALEHSARRIPGEGMAGVRCCTAAEIFCEPIPGICELAPCIDARFLL